MPGEAPQSADGSSRPFVEKKLRDTDLCDNISLSLLGQDVLATLDLKKFPLDVNGYPVTQNETWNACIRGTAHSSKSATTRIASTTDARTRRTLSRVPRTTRMTSGERPTTCTSRSIPLPGKSGFRADTSLSARRKWRQETDPTPLEAENPASAGFFAVIAKISYAFRMPVQLGKKAPAFSAIDQNGKKRTLSSFAGSWLLLYFYPKDETSGCIAEACSLRDQHHRFKQKNLQIVGVSADDRASHQTFIDKYALPFTLLCDTDKTVIRSYGAWKKKGMEGKQYMGIARTSFLINDKGVIVKIYESVSPDDHGEEVLADVEKLQAAA